jgi:hypothetical protein
MVYVSRFDFSCFFIAWLATKIARGDDTTIDYKPKNLNPMFIDK